MLGVRLLSHVSWASGYPPFSSVSTLATPFKKKTQRFCRPKVIQQLTSQLWPPSDPTSSWKSLLFSTISEVAGPQLMSHVGR